MVQTTGESSGDSLTTPTIAPSSSLKSGSTSLKSSTADESTAFSSQSPSSTPSKFETLTSPPLSAMPEIFPTRTKQSTPPASETPETELPEPFTTITQIPDEPSPTKTTTITTLTSLSDVAFITTFVQGIKIGLDDQITKYVTTYTDFQGKPTRTESVLAQASMETTVYRDAHGVPTSTGTYIMLRPPRQTTLTDYQGRATLTQDYYLGLTTQVIYDVDGHPTTTATSMVTKIATLTTLFDEHGVPTLTKTELVPLSLTTTTIVTPTPEVAPNVQSKQAVKVVPISNGKYFLGLMLPTFIAIVVSISVRMIDQSARLYYPFHALASTRGALACDSLCFQTTDMWNLSARFRSLLSGDILLTLTGLLVLGSIILVPLTSEAVRIILKGPNCATSGGDSSACVMVLGVNPVQAQAVVALLVFLVIIVLITAIVLRRWETGLSWNPWSLFHMGHLAANNEIRTLLLRRVREKGGNVSNKDMNKTLAKKVFVLTNWEENGYSKYSILIRNETCLKTNGRPTRRKAHRRKTKGSSMPFFVLTWTGRLLFLALLCGMIIGLLIYTITGDGQDYIRYMNGRWRVVRVVFTTIGVFISLIWWSFFQSVAFLLPHKLLHRIRLYNGEAAYITPPTNPFTGVWSSLTPGRRDVYLGLVSATSILSEILPMLLSTSLDKCTESFWAHTVCLWMSVGVLSVMVFTITGFSFVDWPPSLPMDPSTIAGGMYYTLTNFISMSPSSGLLFGKESPGMV
ncbi:uncharacterized protein F4812DRAFT_188306 [Daldinia caldariorum]|uniref:uncharacterized protein n=1 Tax=Daldinia caldariorum TaxID=326644 RepID=UPI0020087111|nr:uncharacterized protein F4812DRAFT_188306 [Daldinia caldariorum]KAI1471676.1 hypothetical protein F4812DRAFT_188306 [Daldinia caldariorum]